MNYKNPPHVDPYHLAGQFVEGWTRMIELWDQSAVEHSRRVARVAVQLARKSGWSGRELVLLEWGALLHDMGKVCIPASIILREGPLSEKEWDIVKRHPIFGAEMIKPVQIMQFSADIVQCHHENWDGSGYPRGVKGIDIPGGARIVAVAEVWDALTSNPADRKSWPKSRVIAYIRDHSAKKFDPAVVATFCDMAESLGTV
jgi:putative nucleotidyltransferase with HDIG domain